MSSRQCVTPPSDSCCHCHQGWMTASMTAMNTRQKRDWFWGEDNACPQRHPREIRSHLVNEFPKQSQSHPLNAISFAPFQLPSFDCLTRACWSWRESRERGRTAEPAVAEHLSAVNNQSFVSTQTPAAIRFFYNPVVSRERDRQLGRQTCLRWVPGYTQLQPLLTKAKSLVLF